MTNIISLDSINKEREILFFKTVKPIINEFRNGHVLFILMSKKIDEEGFYRLFPHTEKVTKEEFDRLHEMPMYLEVVPVGDDEILDVYFTDRSLNI